MVLTRNKFGLHFTNPNAKAGDTKDQNEATSHHKDQLGKDTDLDARVVEDDELGKNSSDDVEDDPQDSLKDDPRDTLKDDCQDKFVDDQFNVIMLDKMTRIEVVMIALTNGNPTAQMPPANDAAEKTDPKDLGTSNPRKDKGKGKVGETLKKASQTKQQKKSKTVSQPP
uniref:Uncharacterized protein n=1 Tax=Cannabis sativa TaxID=3483 RepID=A0A803QCP3_CANSA